MKVIPSLKGNKVVSLWLRSDVDKGIGGIPEISGFFAGKDQNDTANVLLQIAILEMNKADATVVQYDKKELMERGKKWLASKGPGDAGQVQVYADQGKGVYMFEICSFFLQIREPDEYENIDEIKSAIYGMMQLAVEKWVNDTKQVIKFLALLKSSLKPEDDKKNN